MLVMTPIWAIAYYHQPFIGALLEPNNVVSKITGRDWPVSSLGVGWPDRLVVVDSRPVSDVAQVNASLQAGGFDLLELTFQHPESGTESTLNLAPIQMPLGDFVTLFLIPYLVGLVFLLIGLTTDDPRER